MIKKYELSDQYIVHNGRKLYRIISLLNFKGIRKGDYGGYIESERNLSHKGLCWIYPDVKVWGNALISGNVILVNNIEICNNAKVYGDYIISKPDIIGDNAIITCEYLSHSIYSFDNLPCITKIVDKTGKTLYNTEFGIHLSRKDVIHRVNTVRGGIKKNPLRVKYIELLQNT